jgi:hypothetical protein
MKRAWYIWVEILPIFYSCKFPARGDVLNRDEIIRDEAYVGA